MYTNRKSKIEWGQQIKIWLPLKREFVTHSSQEEGTCCTLQGHVGKNQGQSEVDEEGVSMDQRGFIVTFMGGNMQFA